MLFVLGTLFGILLGMVLNHAIEEAERRREEADRLRLVVQQLKSESIKNTNRKAQGNGK